MLEHSIKAEFSPRKPELWDSKMIECCFNKKKLYDFVFAYELENGEQFWEPTDENFPTSKPISELDLIIAIECEIY